MKSVGKHNQASRWHPWESNTVSKSTPSPAHLYNKENGIIFRKNRTCIVTKIGGNRMFARAGCSTFPRERSLYAKVQISSFQCNRYTADIAIRKRVSGKRRFSKTDARWSERYRMPKLRSPAFNPACLQLLSTNIIRQAMLVSTFNL